MTKLKDFFLWHRFDSDCIYIGRGHTSNGHIYSYPLNNCWHPLSKPSINSWHKLSVQVSKEASKPNKVDVLVNETFVGSFSSHREVRGYGGPILYSESSSLNAFARSKFRNFHKIGENFE